METSREQPDETGPCASTSSPSPRRGDALRPYEAGHASRRMSQPEVINEPLASIRRQRPPRCSGEPDTAGLSDLGAARQLVTRRSVGGGVPTVSCERGHRASGPESGPAEG